MLDVDCTFLRRMLSTLQAFVELALGVEITLQALVELALGVEMTLQV